jgi:hypothetical protein
MTREMRRRKLQFPIHTAAVQRLHQVTVTYLEDSRRLREREENSASAAAQVTVSRREIPAESAKMGIRAVSITRALIKYLPVRGISAREHGRHQSTRLDRSVFIRQRWIIHRPQDTNVPGPFPHVAAMKNASPGKCMRPKWHGRWPAPLISGNMRSAANRTQTTD